MVSLYHLYEIVLTHINQVAILILYVVYLADQDIKRSCETRRSNLLMLSYGLDQRSSVGIEVAIATSERKSHTKLASLQDLWPRVLRFYDFDHQMLIEFVPGLSRGKSVDSLLLSGWNRVAKEIVCLFS